ncbi:MAG: ABC transporter permease [Gemmatimonadota bacterium]
MTELTQDVRFALRTLKKGWGVAAVAVLSLAVAIGGNTAVFGLIHSLLFQPLSVTEPERLVVLQERRQEQPSNLSTLTTSLPNYADLKERATGAAGWAAFRPTVLGLRGSDRAEPVSSAQVTTGFFEVLGINLPRGRRFLTSEGVEGAPRVAVIRPEFWERARGGEGDPLGQILTLNGEPHEVVGVLPEAFTFLFSGAEIFVPLTDNPRDSPRDRRDVLAIARLAPSATMEQFRAEMSTLAGQLAAEHPAVQREWTLDAFNARTDIPDARTKIFYGLLQGSVFFVLLIACANITNLLLAQGQDRKREIALRTLLGADRGRIARQLLTESGVLVGAGAISGLALGWFGIRAMAHHFAGFLPAGYSPTLDGTVVLFTAGVSILAGLIFGLVPALQTFRDDHSDALKEGGGRTTGGRRRKLLTRGLVVTEIALSLLALGGGGMLVQSFLELQRADPGFDGSGLLTTRVRVPESKYPDDEERLILHDQVLERARALGGARSAALVNVLPRTVSVPTDTFHIQGRTMDQGATAPRAFSLRASPEYAEALGIAVLRGRFFDEGDRPGQPPVVVVNRSFAEAWFEGTDPVGQHLIIRDEPRQIVGVVSDVQQVIVRTPGQVESEAVYFPVAQLPEGSHALVVAADDPAALKEPLRSTIQALDPDLTLSDVLTMDEVMEQFFTGVRVFNTILGGFGILAILLASLGTYGVLAYQVGQRRHEIGIRMAVGAQGREVVTMVTRQGLWMSVLGLGIGGLAMVPLTQLLRSLMEELAEVHGSTTFAVAGVLFAVTLVASLVPALRASGVDPVLALRDE